MKETFSISEIMRSATAEQKIVWNDLYSKFGERLAVVPLYYSGVTESAPFYNLIARRIYFAYSIQTGAAETKNALVPVIFDDENGNSVMYAYNRAIAVSPQYNANALLIENIYFARCQITNGTPLFHFIKFVGFAINY